MITFLLVQHKSRITITKNPSVNAWPDKSPAADETMEVIMYVIVKKMGDELYVLSEVFFGSDLCPDMPQVIVKTQWTWVDPSTLDAPYMADLMFFEDKADAYALLVAMNLFGDEILFYDVLPVLGWVIAPSEEVPGNE